jgi:hypothetical protein
MPALKAFKPSFSANAWAIWLRRSFSTQSNKISPFNGIMLHFEGGFPCQATWQSFLKNAPDPHPSATGLAFTISPNVHPETLKHAVKTRFEKSVPEHDVENQF